MITILSAVVSLLSFRVRSRASLELELVALRHQVTVLRRRRPGQLRLFSTDRLLWVWLYRVWPQVLNAMVLVKPATVVQWHRKGFQLYGGGDHVAPRELLWRPNRRPRFGVAAVPFFTTVSLGCNCAQNPCMVPSLQQRPMFYSTNQKSSAAIFIGKPIPTPDRVLSRDRTKGTDWPASTVDSPSILASSP